VTEFKGKVTAKTEKEALYQEFKQRLINETNLLDCTCEEEEKKVTRPGGWVCPVHGTMTVL